MAAPWDGFLSEAILCSSNPHLLSGRVSSTEEVVLANTLVDSSKFHMRCRSGTLSPVITTSFSHPSFWTVLAWHEGLCWVTGFSVLSYFLYSIPEESWVFFKGVCWDYTFSSKSPNWYVKTNPHSLCLCDHAVWDNFTISSHSWSMTEKWVQTSCASNTKSSASRDSLPHSLRCL